ncbi:3-oxoacyl-[acyl-carrier-protein] synthase-3 [Prosthecobacter fusiformis]|uniref:3-oxoacyl-[acyl-carrier-protein] synthase-3 n=1 Tax=Prosthecobacter fusiformis TaxID=48464 RepID=A0A4R7RUA5_9BACT|nr:ketoacyl-ACP synthase III [Prosthecobacter fusiformis]TDU69231.1 3-oxoacyl-[acyl-carrier-protein] synthase-3 [Prosthecobacter fusiformis]
MSPVRLNRIVGHIPSGRVDTRERGRIFGYEDDFLAGKLGTTSLAIKEPDDQASDLCVKAARELEKQGITLDDIGAVVVCTQTPDGHGIPHTSAVVHAKLGLADACACFDISLGCSGYVYGLSVIISFMQANKIQKGLFFTSDPYSAIIDPTDQATCLLFGDAATVSLLEAGAPGWQLTDVIFGTQGKNGAAINNRGGKLAMNGRDVFNFALTTVPKQIQSLLTRQELTLEEVDRVVLHQGSRYIVDKLRERMRLPEDKVPLHLTDLGNTVSSAIPLTLEATLQIGSPKRILISGFGVGLSYATGLLDWQSC